MGIEKFFFRDDVLKAPKAHDIDAQEDIDTSKRKFLIGSAAAAAAIVLPKEEAFGADLEDVDTLPEKEMNVRNIRAYQVQVEQGRTVLEDPRSSLREIAQVVLPQDCSFTDEALEGTDFDHEAWYRNGCTDGSWPGVQLRFQEGREMLIPRFAHEPNVEDQHLVKYGNSFFVDGVWVSNRHMFEETLNCATIDENIDIAGCDVNDFGWNAAGKDAIERVSLRHDRRRAINDLHGQVVHILGIHEKRGEASDNVDITTGVAIKLNESTYVKLGMDEYIELRNKEGEKELFPLKEMYENSYMVLLPSDVPLDDLDDSHGLGLSGSPVLTDVDSALKINIPSGIVWGVGKITLSINGERKYFTSIFFHGPDAVAEMVDEAHTVVSMELDKDRYPFKTFLTERVQGELKEHGFYDMDIDGGYGEGTKQAVYDFQRSVFTPEELEMNVIPGVVDLRTWEKLVPEHEGVSKEQIYRSVQ